MNLLDCLGGYRSNRRRLFLAAASGAMSLGSLALGQTTYTWTPPGSGTFNDAANWNPSGVPGGADTGVFNNGASGTVTLASPSAALALQFRNAAGTYTLNLNGQTLTIGNAAAGGIVLGSGTVEVGQINNVVISGGTIGHSGTATLFRIGGSSLSQGNSLTITGATTSATSASTAGNVVAMDTPGSNDNVFTVSGSASVILRSNMSIGALATATLAASTGHTVNVNGATFSLTGGNRGINAINGTINLTNGFSDMGFVRLNAAGNTTTLNFNSGQLYARNLQIDNGRDLLIGNGGATPAIFGPAYSNGTVTVGATTASKDMILNSNGSLVGTGSIMLNSAGGTLRGIAGSTIAPSIIGQPALTTDDRPVGTLQLAGNFDQSNVTLNLDVPGAIGIGTISADKLLINSGNYTHGGTINFDMATYFPPPDTNYEVRVLGFASSTGPTTNTAVKFVNGNPLAFDWRVDGLYLLLPQVAANSVWDVNGGGDWSVPDNWERFTPNGIDTTANFGTIITSPATVNLDSAITVGHVNFTSPIAYTISGGNPLMFDVSAQSASVSATAGSHVISAAVVLSDNTNVDVGAGASVAMTGGVTGAGMTKNGAGALVVGRVDLANLNVAAGSVQVQPNGTDVGRADLDDLTVASTAVLDLTNNAMVVDYSSPGDPTASIRAALTSGYAAGSWNGNGIISSSAATTPGHSVGYARSAQGPAAPIFGTPDDTAVLVRYTRIGDANLDGMTDIGDFSLLVTSFNVPTAEWVAGDFNYDGVTDIADFALLASNFNQSIVARSPVPEPTMASGLALVLSIARRRRR